MLSPADAEIEVPSAKNPVTESVDGGCFGHGQAGKQGCMDTSWCQARRETEAVQILLGAKQGGIQRLYRYSLLGAKHRGKLRLYRYFLVPSMEGN